jgi:cytochrome P450
MSTSDVIGAAPWSDHDPYTDEALLDPWPGYKQLRDAGPAVWLSKYDMFALTRYDSVRRALQDWESFPSRNGVMMNDQMNQVLRGNTLCSDGADHDALRDVLVRPLTPRALRPVRDEITAQAESVVAKQLNNASPQRSIRSRPFSGSPTKSEATVTGRWFAKSVAASKVPCATSCPARSCRFLPGSTSP